MTPLLQNWDTLINDRLNPINKPLLTLNDETIQNFITQSYDEQNYVRTAFLENIFERSKKDKRIYIKLNQVMLVRLINKLHFYKANKDINDKVRNFYTVITGHLENLLNFIKDFFGNYFDQDEMAPAPYVISCIKEQREKLGLIIKALSGKSDSVREIVDIIANDFNHFFSKALEDITYRQLAYRKDLLDRLLTDESISSEDTLNEVMFFVNYNDLEYIAYWCKKLSVIINQLTNSKEKIAKLLLLQKEINQLNSQLICCLHPDLRSLKDHLNHWIDEEIKFLGIDAAPLLAGESFKKTEEVYVHVPFKGAEIYLIHKSFIDSGGAPGETYKSLFEKTASHLTNKNQKGFSIESMQKNSDKVDYESKENVKRFLQKMIRNIDSY